MNPKYDDLKINVADELFDMIRGVDNKAIDNLSFGFTLNEAIFKTIFNPDMTILSFMSGHTEELSKFFAYKVHKTGGFNKYNRFGNSIYLSETFTDKMIELELKKAIKEAIVYVDSLKKDEDIFE